eukprot:TRINITY_DN5748_c2_g1_i2.p1 TRINITY_DN5748_c2_g1~~TRINITY_DN5748_c2_g1_i2.p1  ORF type:complete len:298 (+),score=44.45 TRINITY_DN5748_c2_g1_i2:39-932(+)
MCDLSFYETCMEGQGYAFKVLWNDQVGKHAVATQDIKEGEELINEAALVVWPHPKPLPEICEICLKKKEECEGDCGGGEWMTFLSPQSISSARKWQQTKNQNSVTLEAVCRAVARVMHSVTVVISRNPSIEPKDALLFAAQSFNRLQKPRNELGDWTTSYIDALKDLLTFPKDDSDPLSLLKDEILSKEFVDSIIGGLALNGHTVPLPISTAGPKHYGSGVYVLAATLNHSCSPSACLVPDGNSTDIVVKATRPIKTGDEITLCYVPQGFNLNQRKERLQKYEFTCACEKCQLEGGA